MNQRERFEAWFSRYHEDACEQFGGLDCTNPQGIAEEAWQEAERQMIERCATTCDEQLKALKDRATDIYDWMGGAEECVEAIRALGDDK